MMMHVIWRGMLQILFVVHWQNTAKQIATMNFVVDRMHFKGHIDPWCQENCDPDKFEAMKMVCMHISPARV